MVLLVLGLALDHVQTIDYDVVFSKISIVVRLCLVRFLPVFVYSGTVSWLKNIARLLLSFSSNSSFRVRRFLFFQYRLQIFFIPVRSVLISLTHWQLFFLLLKCVKLCLVSQLSSNRLTYPKGTNLHTRVIHLRIGDFKVALFIIAIY